jgi:hypothetical protein
VPTLDLTPATADIVVLAGDAPAVKVTVSDALTFASMAGGTWAAHVKKSRTDPAPALTLAVTEEEDGVTISVPDTTSTVLGDWERQWSGVYDVRSVKDGREVTLLRGRFTVERDVTV